MKTAALPRVPPGGNSTLRASPIIIRATVPYDILISDNRIEIILIGRDGIIHGHNIAVFPLDYTCYYITFRLNLRGQIKAA